MFWGRNQAERLPCFLSFLSDPGVLGSDLCVCLSVCLWVSETPFWNLTDVAHADQATNSNMAIQGNVAMKVITFEPIQVVPLGEPMHYESISSIKDLKYLKM